MIGVLPEDEASRMADFIKVPETGFFSLFYNFDIAGWSPAMSEEAQRMVREPIGLLFGKPDYADKAQGVFSNAFIYMSLFGYKAWFRNLEANLEGYDGKSLTFYTISCMSLSVLEWRDRCVAEGLMTQAESLRYSAKLLAYIDDGSARLNLPTADYQVAVRMVEIFKEVVPQVFAACGLKIEEAKSYPSDRFAIFLNEICAGAT